ncbi:MAG: MFS transporter [Candidatus Sericytochromatia bacterium]|nr:MFS transporter [Candidatus Sericytochromatia bacterium]
MSSTEAATRPPTSSGPTSRLRWWVLGLVFLAGTLNYIDRQMVAILKPMLQGEFGWTDQEYGHLGTLFQGAAALTYLGIGWVIDKVGLRRSYGAGVAIWSLACMAHGAATRLVHFLVARVVLAAAEAVQTPASMKAIAAWFPLHQQTLAVGLINTSPNIGAILAPLIVPAVALGWGWRTAFVVTGLLGFLWLAAWLLLPRSPGEVHVPQRDVASEELGAATWKQLLRLRETWAVMGAKALTDMVWWFLLFWAPDFLHRQFHLSMKEAGLPLAVIYGLAAAGALSGGVLTSALLRAGMNPLRARKVAMLTYACLILPLPLALRVTEAWHAVLFVGGALFAHQGFSTNLFALAVDRFKAGRVATVISMGALCGNASGMLMLEATGWVLTQFQTYAPMFITSAVVYLLATGVVHLLFPRTFRPS